MRLPRRAVYATVITGLAVLLSSCTGSSGGGSPASSDATQAAPTTSTASSQSSQPALAADQQTYVSIGDSYAAGVQATGRGERAPSRNGFAYQTVTQAKAKGYDLKLVNFGCSGATTESALTTPGCRASNLAPGAPSYSEPQVTAAANYLKANQGKVGLVTIALGGNDITPCADSSTTAEATSCVSSALGTITSNLTKVVTQLRAAAGPATRIVGITYPDVFLGEYLDSDATAKQFASLSVFAFRSLINPQLTQAYAKGGASFADVTTATGAYTPLTQTTSLAPYGTIPVAVAKVCQLTYFCEFRDIHPRTTGYKIIADLVVKALPAR